MNKIAVIGISCLLPGASSKEEFWENLIGNRDLRSDIDKEKMGVDPDKYFVSEKGISDKFYCKKGGFIRDFKMSFEDLDLYKSDLSGLDDVYLWTIHTAREALRDSGYLGKKEILAKCGHILANLSFPTKSSNHLYMSLYKKELEESLKELLRDRNFSLSDFTESKDISQKNIYNAGKPSKIAAKALSLGGVDFCLDAACASSIYSVKIACDYLNSHKTDLMLAGAVSAADPFFINMGFSIFQAYPDNGISNPLDTTSKGLFSSEGAGMFVLKRYEDALRDDDKIYAVIHGTGLSNDGRGQSVLTPSSTGQILSFERAYQNSGINPEDVPYIECHATGTPLGDKVEVNSIDQFFGRYKNYPKIGSVKSNLGHLLTAAGAAGMIKVIMALNEGVIPATINLTKPHISENKVVNENSFVYKNSKTEGSIAAVSGFGFGGTNGHIILEHKSNDEIKKEKSKKHSSSPGKDKKTSLSVIGFDGHFGNLTDIRSFEAAVLDDENCFIDIPENRWMGIDKNSNILKEYGFTDGKSPKGAYIEKFDLDFFRFKIPPNPDDSLIPQQLLILKVADRALRRTSIQKGSNTAVIIAMGTESELHRFRGRVNLQTQMEESFKNLMHGEGLRDLTEICKDSIHNAAKVNQYTSFIGNIMASRLSSVWDFNGPSFTVSAEELSVQRAVEYAQILLSNGEVDAVVVGGVDMSASCENVLLRTRKDGIFIPGEGAGAIVVKRSDAVKDNDRVYAKIKSVDFVNNDDINSVIDSIDEKDIKIDYLEFAQGVPDQFKSKGFETGSVRHNIGNCFAAQGIASLLRTIILSGRKGYKKALVYGNCEDCTSSAIILEGSDGFSNFNYNPDNSGKKLVKEVYTGGKIIRDFILTLENKDRFRDFLKEKIEKSPAQTMKISENKKDLKDNIEFTERKAKGMSIVDDRVRKNLSLLSEGHINFLKTREKAVVELSGLIRKQLGGNIASATHKTLVFEEIREPRETSSNEVTEKAEDYSEAEISNVFVPNVKEDGVIWDEKDLLEFAGGKISNVFGSEYSIIDTYKRCVRLPLPPYLLVTRVTKLDAERGKFKPSKMTTEYDVPFDSWYGIDGQIPWAVSVESGQCDLLLISYIGIDFECKGERVYRLLDCTLTFLDDIPMEGDTLRYDISINSYARNGGNLLFFFSYECFVGDKMVLKMDGGCAGFFTDEELDAGKGIIKTEEEIEERKKIEKRSFTPILNCSQKKFSREELLMITDGKPESCLGENYNQKGLNPSLRFASEKMLMIDRVVNIDIKGGAYGLGEIHAEKILKPDHWYFPCHFKNDEVMAGSLISEGCGQLLQFFLLYLGMQTKTVDARFQPIPELPQKVRCRGQVVPVDAVLTYKLEVKEIGLEPNPYAIADIDIILDDRIVVDFKDLGVQIKEKKPSDPFKMETKESSKQPDKKELYTKEQLENFATGSLEACFGEKYRIYDGRHAPRTPNGDLQLISRVMDFKGTPMDFSKTSEVTTEYDVPSDAWYFKDNSNPYYMPYSIIMEIALQPCGFVSCAMETTLLYPDTDFYFRNLDGKGELLKEIDLRGKTIINRSRLLKTSSMTNTIIQSFDFELICDGEIFYKGDAVFGYFVAGALKNQVGIDNGIDNHPLTERKYLTGDYKSLDLNDPVTRKNLFEPKQDKIFYRAGSSQLDLLNSSVFIDPAGGKDKKGYIYAEKIIRNSDWFFKYHFYQDPVMPGSLGIETMLQAIQIYILDQDLAGSFKNPKFTHNLSETSWSYRGQINPEVDSMAIEVHITSCYDSGNKLVVAADASLWKEKIRIYEAKNLSVAVDEY